MGGEVKEPSSKVTAIGGEGKTEPPDSYNCRKIIEEAFPMYLAMGMSYDEYYKKDHTLVIAYRKAHELKRKAENENMWLQGAYVYEAIRRVAPLLIAFNSHPQEIPYLDKPFELISGESEKEQKENKEAKAVEEKGLAYMKAKMLQINKKFNKE